MDASARCTDLPGDVAGLGVVGVVVVDVVHGRAGVAAGVLRVVGARRAVRVHRGRRAVGTAAVVKAVILKPKTKIFIYFLLKAYSTGSTNSTGSPKVFH